MNLAGEEDVPALAQSRVPTKRTPPHEPVPPDTYRNSLRALKTLDGNAPSNTEKRHDRRKPFGAGDHASWSPAVFCAVVPQAPSRSDAMSITNR